MSDDLKIPLAELRQELKTGKLDADFGEWFLRTRTGTQALATLQDVTGGALFLKPDRIPGLYSIGLLTSHIGTALRLAERETEAFIVAFQAEEYEHALAEAEKGE